MSLRPPRAHRGADWPTGRMIGIAGEHYVASKIAMSGVLPIVVTAGHPGSDVIAEASGRSVTIQVKTRGSTNPGIYDLKGFVQRCVMSRLRLRLRHFVAAGSTEFHRPSLCPTSATGFAAGFREAPYTERGIAADRGLSSGR